MGQAKLFDVELFPWTCLYVCVHILGDPDGCVRMGQEGWTSLWAAVSSARGPEFRRVESRCEKNHARQPELSANFQVSLKHSRLVDQIQNHAKKRR